MNDQANLKRAKHLPAGQLRLLYDGSPKDAGGILGLYENSAAYMQNQLLAIHDGTTTPQPEFFHYTTIDGFSAIVDSGDFWISSYASMNDYDEIQTALNEIEMICIRTLDNSHRSSAPWRPFLQDMKDEFKCFVMSFTRSPVSLGMYRTYSKSGGVCIGFPQALFTEGLNGNWMLADVLYSKEDHTKALLPIAHDICKIIVEKPKDEHNILAHIKSEFSIIAPFIKNWGFHEEQEVRLATLGSGMTVFERQRDQKIVEFVKLSWLNMLVQSETADCAFESIHVSPGANGTDRMKNVCKTLDSRGRLFKMIRETGISAIL